jgi:hypothetical protein
MVVVEKYIPDEESTSGDKEYLLTEPTGQTSINLPGVRVGSSTKKRIPQSAPVPKRVSDQYVRDVGGNLVADKNFISPEKQRDIISKTEMLSRGLSKLRSLRERLKTGPSGLGVGQLSKLTGIRNSMWGQVGGNKYATIYNGIAKSLETPVVKVLYGDVGMITEPDKDSARAIIPKTTNNDDEWEELANYLEGLIQDRREATSQGNFGALPGVKTIKKGGGSGGDSPDNPIK